MNLSGYWRNGALLQTAIGGIDMALWDIKGKEANMPVYQLLGGASRSAVACYGHAGGRDIAELKEDVQRFVDEGYTVVRAQLGGYGGGGFRKGSEASIPDNAWKTDSVFDEHTYLASIPKMFEQLRMTFGPEVHFTHDVHEHLSPIIAIQLAKRLEPYDLFYLEDVLPPEHIGWYRQLRQQSATAQKRFTGLYDRVPRGLIVTDFGEDQLRRFFSPSERMAGQKFLIVGQDGKVLYDSYNNEWTGQEIPSKKFLKLREVNAEGTETLSFEGEDKLITYLRMDSEPWTIVSMTPLHTLTGPIVELNRLLIVFIVIYLICSVAVVVYITLYFTDPVVRLVRLMRKLEEGGFEYKVPMSTRNDEIGWLYRGFGNMIQKIEGLIEQTSRSERKKKELEFQVLSHQINPHFLYNTLESIRWKAENHGRSDIGEMVSALGNLLRLSLNQGKDITTVGREVEQVKAYVHIEQARIGRPLRVLYFFDEETLEMPFMRLLLQPLVENAIQHSIRDNFEKGKVILSGYVEDQDIVIEITDNGKGIPQSVLTQLEEEPVEGKSTRRQGVGLRNVNERLKLYFGNHYKLKIETGEGMGTKITIRHPIMDPNADEQPQTKPPSPRDTRKNRRSPVNEAA
jgi:sensor histidine kinase YesM